jgi:phosphoribosylformylglycinamidine cyclo-ligase
MGVGMIAMVAPGSVDTALGRLRARGVDAWVLGTARERRDGETGDAAAKGGNGAPYPHATRPRDHRYDGNCP